MIALAFIAAFALTAPALYLALTRASRDAHSHHAGRTPSSRVPTGLLLLILTALSAAGQGVLWAGGVTGSAPVSAICALLPVLIYALFYGLDRFILRLAA